MKFGEQAVLPEMTRQTTREENGLLPGHLRGCGQWLPVLSRKTRAITQSEHAVVLFALQGRPDQDLPVAADVQTIELRDDLRRFDSAAHTISAASIR
jgi:hypothetical protein